MIDRHTIKRCSISQWVPPSRPSSCSSLSAPLWFFDAVDKEAMVLAIPYGIRRALLKIMFRPTLLWTMLLHRAMPEQRRWYDRVDHRVIIGAYFLRTTTT
jgi:hypothetical protein